MMAVAALVALVSGCNSEPDFTTLEEALDNQRAELVSAFEDGFVIGDAEAPCGFPRHAGILMVDAESGRPLWERAVPWAPDGAGVIGDTVVAVGQTVDGNPPSVVAADLMTGTPRWQRFVASENLRMVGVTSSTVVVQSDERLQALDIDTGEVRWDKKLGVAHLLASSLGAADDGSPVPTSSALAVFSTGETLSVADLSNGRIKNLGPAVAAALDGSVLFVVANRSVRAYSGGADATVTWESGPLPLDDIYSKPVKLIAGKGTVVVMIGSDVGPDHRIVVLDGRTGELRWRDDGARDAAIALDVLLVDRRHGSDPDGLTRQTLGRALDSGDELWLRPSSGFLGGYLGGSRASLEYAVADNPQADIDGVVRLYAVTGEGVGAPEAPLQAGSRQVGASLVTDELIVVTIGDRSLSAFDGAKGQSRWFRSVAYPVRNLSTTNEGVLIATGDDDVGCD